jgi:hypothetical protein
MDTKDSSAICIRLATSREDKETTFQATNDKTISNTEVRISKKYLPMNLKTRGKERELILVFYLLSVLFQYSILSIRYFFFPTFTSRIFSMQWQKRF